MLQFIEIPEKDEEEEPQQSVNQVWILVRLFELTLIDIYDLGDFFLVFATFNIQ